MPEKNNELTTQTVTDMKTTLNEILTLLKGPLDDPKKSGLVGTVNDNVSRIDDLEKKPERRRKDIKWYILIITVILSFFKNYIFELIKWIGEKI